MLLNYMISWSAFMMFFIGLIKLRSLIKFCIMGILSASLLVLTWVLVIEPPGMDISAINPLANPDAYIKAGPSGWLILIILPCGWFAPILGANVAERWATVRVHQPLPSIANREVRWSASKKSYPSG